MLADFLTAFSINKNSYTAAPRTVIVLGMHRSGTSAFTGALEDAGLYLGDVVEHASDNVKGSRESNVIMTLHEDILQRSGASWRSPQTKLTFSPVHTVLKRLIIQSYSNYPVWGFKDPRSLLVLDFWLKDLPNAELVGIFRHPFYVAESLHRRNGISYFDGIELWMHYNRILLWHAANKPTFPIVEFCKNVAIYESNLARVISALELDKSVNSGFFDNLLRQDELPNLSSEKNSAQAIVLYEKLQRLV